jgi:menaquinone-dependent protoporphyrinogen oxidase
VLVTYATIEGHTMKVAQRIHDRIVSTGHEVVLVESSNLLSGFQEEGEYDGVIICGPVHQGRHPVELADLVRDNREDLSRIPTAFISVSLSAAVPDPEFQEEAQSYVDGFLADTGWQPTETLLVAGALMYTKYDYMKRLVMRMISERRRVDSDTSRDYVYTDWNALDSFVSGFLQKVQSRQRSAVAASLMARP